MSARAVTAAEADSLHERGWVRLPGLIDAATTAALLGRAQELRERAPTAAPPPGTLLFPSEHDALFREFACDAALGRVAASLLAFDGGMRLWGDAVAVVDGGTRLPPAASHWHQDAGKLPLDRAAVGLWIALDEITTDQGPLRFREGSHLLGPLGALESEAAIHAWPRLARCPVSGARELAPGDATAHLSLTVLAAGDNRSSRTLWPYSLKYFPDGTRYTGMGVSRTAGMDLETFSELGDPAFPIAAG